MHFHIITLFPNAFDSYLNESILGRAQEKGKITISYYNPRDYTDNPWHRVDRKPYGGGPGMVLESEPFLKAAAAAIGRKKNVPVFIMSPRGRQFDAAYATQLASSAKHIVLICGHYEGIDARVGKILKAEEISVGPYVLTGGELPAMLIVDAVARHVTGVLGNSDSIEEGRVASGEVYTRPEVLKYKGKKYVVPPVLLSGNHKEIEEWKKRGSKDH